MDDVQRRLEKDFQISFFHLIFSKIAEPRVLRILQFAIYLFLLWSGGAVLLDNPDNLARIIGESLVTLLGLFIFSGSLLCAVAVLPGIWWLERVGIILLTTSVAMYAVIIHFNHASPVVVAFTLALAVTFGQRWVEISGAQLAPKDPELLGPRED